MLVCFALWKRVDIAACPRDADVRMTFVRIQGSGHDERRPLRHLPRLHCLPEQAGLAEFGKFVHDGVHYNGRRNGLSGYREMLERDFRAIPDLYFEIQLLISEPPRIASRLQFECTPRGVLFGLPVNGRKVQFAENVFYEFLDGRIENVWSTIDKAAIESQL